MLAWFALLSAVLAQNTFRYAIPTWARVADAPPTEAASAGFGVRLEMLVRRGGGGFVSVPTTTPVCGGDAVAFRMTPSEPGFIAVFNQGTSGRTTLLFPAHLYDDNRMTPDRPVRVPQEGTGFPVGGEAGQEGILLFFSPTPFSPALKALGEALVSGNTTAAPPAGPAPTLEILRDLGPAPEAWIPGRGERSVAFTLTHTEPCP